MLQSVAQSRKLIVAGRPADRDHCHCSATLSPTLRGLRTIRAQFVSSAASPAYLAMLAADSVTPLPSGMGASCKHRQHGLRAKADDSKNDGSINQFDYRTSNESYTHCFGERGFLQYTWILAVHIRPRARRPLPPTLPKSRRAAEGGSSWLQVRADALRRRGCQKNKSRWRWFQRAPRQSCQVSSSPHPPEL